MNRILFIGFSFFIFGSIASASGVILKDKECFKNTLNATLLEVCWAVPASGGALKEKLMRFKYADGSAQVYRVSDLPKWSNATAYGTLKTRKTQFTLIAVDSNLKPLSRTQYV